MICYFDVYDYPAVMKVIEVSKQPISTSLVELGFNTAKFYPKRDNWGMEEIEFMIFLIRWSS